MLKIFSVLLLSLVYSLQAGEIATPDLVTANAKQGKKNQTTYHALLANQAAVTNGQNIPWLMPSVTSSSGVQLSNSGQITLSTAGTYLVQYTVRVSRSPSNGSASVTAQLQQSSGGAPVNISQPAITSTSSTDGIDETIPATQTQITGFAIITVQAHSSNTINVAVSITGSNMTIDATSGTDANAQLLILQL